MLLNAKRAFNGAFYSFDGHAVEASVYHELVMCNIALKDVWHVPEAQGMYLKLICIKKKLY